jgi:hypothetical protein
MPAVVVVEMALHHFQQVLVELVVVALVLHFLQE